MGHLNQWFSDLQNGIITFYLQIKFYTECKFRAGVRVASGLHWFNLGDSLWAALPHMLLQQSLRYPDPTLLLSEQGWENLNEQDRKSKDSLF